MFYGIDSISVKRWAKSKKKILCRDSWTKEYSECCLRHVSQLGFPLGSVQLTSCQVSGRSRFYFFSLQLFLTSPQGTKSTLLQKRPRDSSKDGFKKWSFLTVHSWGEMAMGTWTLEIRTTYTTGTMNPCTCIVRNRNKMLSWSVELPLLGF